MVIVLLVLMVLVVFSIILVGKLLGQMFAKLLNSFFKNKIRLKLALMRLLGDILVLLLVEVFSVGL